MRWALQALVQIFILGFSTNLFAETKSSGGQDKYYQVVKVKGQAYFLPPLTATWIPLAKGTEIAENSLVQVGEDGLVRLRQKGKTTERSLEVELSQPIIVRLSAAIIRDVETRQYSVSRLKKLKVGAQKDLTPKNPFEKFAEAWKKDMLFFRDMVADGQETAFQQPAAAMGTSVQPLKMISPTAQGIVAPNRLPTSVVISWETPKKKPESPLKYRIYIWPKTGKKGDAHKITTESEASVDISKAGQYYVQVTTEDGAYAAKPVLFEVLNYASQTTNLAKGSQPGTLNRNLQLTSPPNDFKVLNANLPFVLEFSWRLLEVERSQFTYVLVIQSGQKIIKIPTDLDRLTYQVSQPGTYQWSVEAWTKSHLRQTSSPTFISKPRMFSLDNIPTLNALTAIEWDKKPKGYYLIDGAP